jgi:hypothetical protein
LHFLDEERLCNGPKVVLTFDLCGRLPPTPTRRVTRQRSRPRRTHTRRVRLLS